jgi:CheY-like chemotaxis protein
MDEAAPRPAADAPGGAWQGFQDLMPWRVQDVLLVSSLYDAFILQEDGQLNELILSDVLDLHLHHTPGITHVSSGRQALALARQQPRFNLIVTAIQTGDMDATELAREVRAAGLDVPVVVLAYDERELNDFVAGGEAPGIERCFLWQGNPRILIAIVKAIEDQRNAAHDTATTGVRVILLVEDSIRFYSSYLPTIYTEVIRQSERLISEGVNLTHKLVRLRARPKILLCTTYEEAWERFLAYRDTLLGIITDIEFPRRGRRSPEAGFELVRMARAAVPDLPILFQSSRPEFAARAAAVGAPFLLKGSDTMLHDLRRALAEQFAFGDFVFRRPDGSEVDRAGDLKTLEEKLHTVPAESIGYHAERNHFSNWLTARTEFAIAHRLRPRRVSEYTDLEELRRDLIESIAGYRRDQADVLVGDFDRATFDPSAPFFLRIGGGSLGGKARGLAFVRHLLGQGRVRDLFPDVRIGVPPAVVLGTDVFDRFLADNDLLDFALHSCDETEIRRRFLAASFPGDVLADLAAFLAAVHCPLAVRSSSLLEDSQYQPFTGVYETFMLPNHDPDPGRRLERLLDAVRLVYASTFSRHARGYLRATPYRLEEEKMAVILQMVVGAPHGGRFYPDFSGVARSLNFYPAAPLRPEDGVAAVALGLGRSVVEGEKCLSFCPRYPQHLLQFSTVKDIVRNSQRQFWALELEAAADDDPEHGLRECRFELEAAGADGTLAAVASTYSHENGAVYDGMSRPGVRLVSFAPVLKHGAFPLAGILEALLARAARGLNRPVEIEFAVRLDRAADGPPEFGFLQLRPLVVSRETAALDVEDASDTELVCRSDKVLGNGRLDDLRHAVVVDFHRFDRAQSREAAQAVARFNADLVARGLPYLLIGVGRWGSTDPWLGIPVTWDEISGARVIVEAGFRDLRVSPSQGSHFFQNLTSFQVGYFTANPEVGDGFVDWDWLAAQPAEAEDGHVRLLAFERPLVVKMNGRRNVGLIRKPRG